MNDPEWERDELDFDRMRHALTEYECRYPFRCDVCRELDERAEALERGDDE